WGGVYGALPMNDGARYDPVTDVRTPISNLNAPSPRWVHSAVWTGSEMIVWGGFYNPSTGGRYDPMTDTRPPTSPGSAPGGRHYHAAIWTGDVMGVWGGYGGPQTGPTKLDTGGRYDPRTDSWSPTSNAAAPPASLGPSAVWTGNVMVVWGGYGAHEPLDTGGRYGDRSRSRKPRQLVTRTRLSGPERRCW